MVNQYKGLGQRRSETIRRFVRLERLKTQSNAPTVAFAEFENATVGCFNGFAFVKKFHEKYSKLDALEILNSDDCANVVTSKGAKIHVCEDDIKVYIMTENAQNGGKYKIVLFNYSAYVF